MQVSSEDGTKRFRPEIGLLLTDKAMMTGIDLTSFTSGPSSSS